jgi:hypothetical protein
MGDFSPVDVSIGTDAWESAVAIGFGGCETVKVPEIAA